MSAFSGTYECKVCLTIWDGSQLRQGLIDSLPRPLCGNESCGGEVTYIDHRPRTQHIRLNRGKSIAEAEEEAARK